MLREYWFFQIIRFVVSLWKFFDSFVIKKGGIPNQLWTKSISSMVRHGFPSKPAIVISMFLLWWWFEEVNNNSDFSPFLVCQKHFFLYPNWPLKRVKISKSLTFSRQNLYCGSLGSVNGNLPYWFCINWIGLKLVLSDIKVTYGRNLAKGSQIFRLAL